MATLIQEMDAVHHESLKPNLFARVDLKLVLIIDLNVLIILSLIVTKANE